jgi:hypothetical protein
MAGGKLFLQAIVQRWGYDAAMSDPAPPKPSLAAFKKFVRAMSQIPKRELDAKLAEWERRRRPARARRKRSA